MSELSNFDRLNRINVNGRTEQKNGLTYLSWAWAWAEVKKAFPNAIYTIYERDTEYGPVNYFTDGRTCWVKTGVTIDGLEHIEELPVMDFRNRSIPLESVVSTDVNKAIQRSLTKACARHGLGLYIYAGDDLPESEQVESEDEQNQEPIEEKNQEPKEEPILCEYCHKPITPITSKGKILYAPEIAQRTKAKFGACLCSACVYKFEKESTPA